jgi:hypothetical protein
LRVEIGCRIMYLEFYLESLPRHQHSIPPAEHRPPHFVPPLPFVSLVSLQLRAKLSREVVVRVGVVPILLPLLHVLGVLLLGAPLCGNGCTGRWRNRGSGGGTTGEMKEDAWFGWERSGKLEIWGDCAFAATSTHLRCRTPRTRRRTPSPPRRSSAVAVSSARSWCVPVASS